MKARIITVTHKMPSWLKDACHDYVIRLPASLQLEILEIPLVKRHTSSIIANVVSEEGEKILAAIKPHHHVVTLAIDGKGWSTEEFAEKVRDWQARAVPVDFVIGGPDGLSNQCMARANETWSLSCLTFPHHLVRLLLLEQWYRAHAILRDHPYHR